MKTLTAKWFECKVLIDKLAEEGDVKRVKELYVVDAVSFAEAEIRVTEEVSGYSSGEFDVIAEKIAPFREVFVGDGDKYYLCKVNILTVDEKTGKVKKNRCTHLVQAFDFESARSIVKSVYDKSMVDYEIGKLSETSIIDLYSHEV